MTHTHSTQPTAAEQSVALTRDFRLLQKRRGHRYSVDDMLVAQLAATWGLANGRAVPQQLLDLGCGLGSVLLILAWALPEATCVGLEVMAEHVDYARRNVALNGCVGRVRIVSGDLRDLALIDTLGRFDLVTGSPPYFLPGSGTLCTDPARAAAHFELHGGIEDYALAASRVLAPDSLFVACAPVDPPERAENAFRHAGLSVLHRRAVVPRVGKAPFLQLLVGGKGAAAPCAQVPPLILREADNHRSEEHRAIRRWTGL